MMCGVHLGRRIGLIITHWHEHNLVSLGKIIPYLESNGCTLTEEDAVGQVLRHLKRAYTTEKDRSSNTSQTNSIEDQDPKTLTVATTTLFFLLNSAPFEKDIYLDLG